MAGDASVLGYVSARVAIDNAATAGLSVCDYLEQMWGETGKHQCIARNLMALTGTRLKRVCEIGTGAGLVATHIQTACLPSVYESYEPDSEWAAWLQASLDIVSHHADGRTLNFTAATSVDLTLANGVFVYLPFLSTYGYLEEMCRVTEEHGYIAFDVFSEHCLDDTTVHRWLDSNDHYPAFLSSQYLVEFFRKRAISLVGRFFAPYGVGRSE